MRVRTFVVLFLLLCGSTYAQNFKPKKDLPFGQIAAGGGYVSVLTVSNQGVTAYSGTLEMYSGTGIPWNPIVNGSPTISGMVPVMLAPGETKVFRITLDGNTQSAFGFIRGTDLSQTSFIEGNLTYFVSSAVPVEATAGENPPVFAEGDTPYEGVGVPPSSEFYRSIIPFEDPFTIALALANVNLATADITLTVNSGLIGEPEDGSNRRNMMGTVQIGPNGHDVGFLWQKVEGLQNTPGWLQIDSTHPIIGTALIFVPSDISPAGSLFASLPLQPAAFSYIFTGTVGGFPVGGEIGMWANGPFINGYIVLSSIFGSPLPTPERFNLFGELQTGSLRISGYGTSTLVGGNPVSTVVTISDFSFGGISYSGTFTVTDVTTGMAQTGTALMNKVF